MGGCAQTYHLWVGPGSASAPCARLRACFVAMKRPARIGLTCVVEFLAPICGVAMVKRKRSFFAALNSQLRFFDTCSCITYFDTYS